MAPEMASRSRSEVMKAKLRQIFDTVDRNGNGSIDMCGALENDIDFHRFPSFSMYLSWISMDFNGFQWISMDTLMILMVSNDVFQWI